MHQSFGSNEEITQRRDGKLQRLRRIDAELMGLQQEREQVKWGSEGNTISETSRTKTYMYITFPML